MDKRQKLSNCVMHSFNSNSSALFSNHVRKLPQIGYSFHSKKLLLWLLMAYNSYSRKDKHEKSSFQAAWTFLVKVILVSIWFMWAASIRLFMFEITLFEMALHIGSCVSA